LDVKSLSALLCLLALGASAYADLNSDVAGNWQYDGFFYQGHRYPNPNPALKLTFTFNADQSERLYWKRDDEAGFCERKGTWSLQSDLLNQTVTWLNPANDPSCAQDSDMQMGRATQNHISIDKDELSIHMDLNGQDFIYLLKRLVQ
jgi:hypothetical protein